MIKSFQHKGLRRLYETGDSRGIRPDHADKVNRILARLDVARTILDMDLPGYRLHPLKGGYKGFHAVTVQANWRIIFRFNDGDAEEVNYLDYH